MASLNGLFLYSAIGPSSSGHRSPHSIFVVVHCLPSVFLISLTYYMTAMELIRRNSKKLKRRLSKNTERHHSPNDSTTLIDSRRHSPEYSFSNKYERTHLQSAHNRRSVSFDVETTPERTLHENYQILNELYDDDDQDDDNFGDITFDTSNIMSYNNECRNTIPHSQSYQVHHEHSNQRSHKSLYHLNGKYSSASAQDLTAFLKPHHSSIDPNHQPNSHHRKSLDTISAWIKTPRSRKNTNSPSTKANRKSIDYATLQKLKAKACGKRIDSEPTSLIMATSTSSKQRPHSLIMTASDPSYQSVHRLDVKTLSNTTLNSMANRFSKSTSSLNIINDTLPISSPQLKAFSHNSQRNARFFLQHDTDADSMLSTTSSRHIKFDIPWKLSPQEVTRNTAQNSPGLSNKSSSSTHSNLDLDLDLGIDYYRSTSLSSTPTINAKKNTENQMLTLSSALEITFAVLFHIFNLIFSFPCYIAFKLGIVNVSVLLLLFLYWYSESKIFKILENLTLSSFSADRTDIMKIQGVNH